MRAMVTNAAGAVEWSEVPDPVPPGAGRVVIEVHAAGVNRADLMQRAGAYPAPDGWPPWMGLEVAGVIAAAGPDSPWQPGDRVCALLGGGGYAEYVSVPAGMVLPVPDGLSMVEAAAIPETFATAYLNLVLEGGMAAGDTVFIQAGASGLGMTAIQLAKRHGAAVVTTVGSEAKRDFVRGLGADVVIDRKRECIPEVLAQHPVDIALDCVAGPLMGECLRCMRPGGRWIVIATLGGAASELDASDLFRRGVRVIGSTLRGRSDAVKADIMAGLRRDTWTMLSSGAIRVLVHETVPIQEVDAAHRILEADANLGKVVLGVRGGA